MYSKFAKLKQILFIIEMFEKHHIIELANYKMPYGKYKGRHLTDIPEEYYIWHKHKGWPNGKLGTYMQMMYELMANGEIDFLRKLRY